MSTTVNIDGVLAALGGPYAVASHCGIVPTAVYNWRILGFPRSRLGDLLELAKERGVDKSITLEVLTALAVPRVERLRRRW